MRRTPLPTHLTSAPFAVQGAPLSPKRLRANDLDRTVYGVRNAAPAQDLATRCRMFALRLRNDVFFSHSTAALLYDAPLPWALERAKHLHVSVPAGQSAPHARGLVGHTTAFEERDIVMVSGLRVSSPARTWADLGAFLSLPDLVAVGDHLLRHFSHLSDLAGYQDIVRRMSGQRGIRNLRLALPLLDPGAESRPESRLRVIIVTAGLPTPQINHSLVDSETGRQVRPDFTFSTQKTILEYQGAYHRTLEQWRKDMTRRSTLEARGWKVMELNADDLRDPAELVSRIRALLARP